MAGKGCKRARPKLKQSANGACGNTKDDCAESRIVSPIIVQKRKDNDFAIFAKKCIFERKGRSRFHDRKV